MVYPNTGEFTIELNNGSVKNIDVMDVTGRVIISNTSSNDKVDFNIDALANGIYYVRIQANNSVETIKIVKQKLIVF
ncbi:MAG: T9SS type A sorting domain-containing protein [Bacteroidetes bacterium]|nr:T9SS type A sorting domain-containing protein [Bacteroidota bacterium]